MLLAAIFSVCACTPGLDPEEVDSGKGTETPASDDRIHFTMNFDTNLQEYISVQYAVIGLTGKSRYAVVTEPSTLSYDWRPNEGTIQVAFLAQQINDFSSSVLSKGVTFNVSVSVQTPTDGYSVKWCGLNDTKVESDDILYDYTIKALNKGIAGQPEGTGNTKYLEFQISLAKEGGYKITPRWVKGDIHK